MLRLAPALERFPRSQKFLLGDRIQGTAFEVLEWLIETTYRRQRGNHLARANLGVEKRGARRGGAPAAVLDRPRRARR